MQGDAYSLRRLLETLLLQPAAAVVSGLPLVTKPIKQRLRLIRDAFDLMAAGRAVRAIHLFGGGAAAEAAWRVLRGSFRAHLDEHSAGAGLGVSEA